MPLAALSLVRARYIIETEEWSVQPMAENASNETILANGFSAVKTGDMATAEKMEAALAAKAEAAPGGGRRADQPARRSWRGTSSRPGSCYGCGRRI